MTTPAFWVHITDGTIDYGPAPLPRDWRHVSSLNGLSDAELAPLGWHPCPGEAPTYDSSWQNISGPTAVEDEEGWYAEWIITDRPLEDVQTEKLKEIREEAGRRIIAIVPEYKQRNLLAEAMTLTATYGPRKDWGEDVPAPIVAKWEAGAAVWAQVKAIRDASDVAEEQIISATTPEEAANVTANWPE